MGASPCGRFGVGAGDDPQASRSVECRAAEGGQALMLASRRRGPDAFELLVVVTAGIAAALFFSSPHRPAVSAPAAVSPPNGVAHQTSLSHRGGGVSAAAHSVSTHGNQLRAAAEALVRPSLDTAWLVHAGPLYSLTRGRVERQHRQRLLRRNAVPDRYLAVCRWAFVSASCLAARAAIPRVPGVAS